MNRLTDRKAVVWVLCCAVLSYVTALAGVFVYDDIHTVQDNPAIRSLASIPSFFVDVDTFSQLQVRMYRPVVVSTLALDYAISGSSAWMFKLTNVLIHAGCAVLLLRLARSLGAKLVPATFAASLFAAHPMASEVTNMISSRSDSLAALGILLGLCSYVAWQDGRRGAVLGVVLGGVIACGSKATGVVLPALCVVLELCRSRDDALRNRALRILPAAAVALAYLFARKATLGMATASVPKISAGHDVLNGAGRDLVTQFCLMANVLPKFFAQSIVPVGLTIDPWIPLHDRWWSAAVLCGWLAVGALTVLGLRAPRRRPAVFAGTCIAWATALPWVVLPLNLPACEHRFYGALVGLGLVLAAVVPATPPRAARWGMVALVVAFGAGAASRSLDYRDAEVLWEEALEQHPRSVRALCGLAIERRDDAYRARAKGDLEGFLDGMHRARALLERAIAIYPRHYAARRNLAEFHIATGAEHGSSAVAIAMAESLVEAEPRNPFYRLLLSRALAFGGRFDAAVEAALYCLEIAEPKGLVYRTAASAKAASGDLPGAIELLDTSVARGLDHESVLLQRADYLVRQHRMVAAERDVQAVLSRDPFHPDALRLLDRIRGRAAPGR